MIHKVPLLTSAAVALTLALAGCSAPASAPAAHHAASVQSPAPTTSPSATPPMPATPASSTFGDQFRTYGRFSAATDAEAQANAEAWCKALPTDGYTIVAGIIQEGAGISATQAQQLLALVTATYCPAESGVVAAG